MKKNLALSLLFLLMPTNMVFAETDLTELMYQNPKIAALIKEKQEKMAALEKCTGTTKSLKIAGLSTLGITAIGVGVNIAEANAIKKNDNKISSIDTQISTTEKEIKQKQEIIAARQEEERKKQEAATAAAAEEVLTYLNI